MHISLLLDLPISGLYALQNDIDSKVYVLYSSNIYVALGKLLTGIKDRSNVALRDDVSKLRLVVLETCPSDFKLLRSRYNHWVDVYSKKGYSSYRNYAGSKYKVSIRLVQTPTGDYEHRVYLVSKRSRKILLAVFLTATEADSWVAATYKDVEHLSPVYEMSELSISRRRTSGAE